MMKKFQGMGKTKIEWCDYTWNPVTGCDRDCWYCYGKRIVKLYPKNFPNEFKPTFYLSRISQPLRNKKPCKIFTCSMAEMFGSWVNPEWISNIFKVIKKCYWHQFLILTKYPENIEKFISFENITTNTWLGVTITLEDFNELKRITNIKNYPGIKFVSLEPLLDYPKNEEQIHLLMKHLKLIDWIIIGGLTGYQKKNCETNLEMIDWINEIIEFSHCFDKPIFLKDNLLYHEKIQEFPEYKTIGCLI